MCCTVSLLEARIPGISCRLPGMSCPTCSETQPVQGQQTRVLEYARDRKSAATRPYCISGNRLLIKDLLWISSLQSPHYIPLIEQESIGPSGTLADVTIGTIRPNRIATTGPLSEPAIPVSPQTAGPGVPERGIAPGGVSGCSALPGSQKVQPARQSSRIQGGQDTIECHGGLDVIKEKIDQCEQDNPGLNERGMIDDFRLRGSSRCRQMGRHLSDGGGGGLTWRRSCYAQRFSLRGRSSPRCGSSLSRNAAPDAGQHGIPASVLTKRTEAAPRVSPLARRNGASH